MSSASHSDLLPAAESESPWHYAWLLAIVTVATYLPVLRGGFIWDDSVYITANPLFQLPGGLAGLWAGQDMDYQPVTGTIWWIEWRLWGASPTGYHVVNVLLHVCNALLAWRVMKRLGLPAPWLAALLFAVHPVAVATVAWISEGKNTISMLFYLLSLLLFLHSEQEQPTSRKKWLWYSLSLMSFVLALLSKGSVVVLPAVLLLCLWWLRGWLSARDFIKTIPFFLLAGIFSVVTIRFQYRLEDAQALVMPPIHQQFANAGAAVWFYLFKALAPVRLNVVYPRWPSPPTFLPLALLVVCFAALCFWRRSWGRALLFGLSYFVIALIPALGFFRISFLRLSPVADHWQYLALPAIAALLATGVHVLRRRWRLPFSRTMLPACMVALLCALSAQRASIYSSSETLWSDALTKNPNSACIHANLGLELMNRGLLAQAVEHFSTALELEPDFLVAHANLGCASVLRGDYATAEKHFIRALQSRPTAFAEGNYGLLLEHLGRGDEAIEHLEQAVRLEPRAPSHHDNLSRALARRERWDQAIAQAREAIQLGLNSADQYVYLGNLYRAKGDIDEAVKQYEQAIARDATHLDAHTALNSLRANPAGN